MCGANASTILDWKPEDIALGLAQRFVANSSFFSGNDTDWFAQWAEHGFDLPPVDSKRWISYSRCFYVYELCMLTCAKQRAAQRFNNQATCRSLSGSGSALFLTSPKRPLT